MQAFPSGVIPPLVTPLTVDRDVDVEALERLVNFQIDSGVHGLFALGSSGEVSFLTDVQRDTVVQTVVASADGRVPVLVGAIDTSAARIVEQISRAADRGADYAVTTAPFYAKINQRDILDHFRHVAGHSALPVVAYDIPVAVHSKLAPTTVLTLAEERAIVALKDSSGVQAQFREVVMGNRELGRPLKIFTGTEVVADADLLIGADGIVPGLGNVDPASYGELYNLLAAGQWEEGRILQDRLVHLFRIINADESLTGPAQAIGAFKEAMRLRDIITTSVTAAPSTLLSEPAKKTISTIVTAHFA